MAERKLKVGDPVWIFDVNHPIYAGAQVGPIFRKHFRRRWIVGEVKRSWLIAPRPDGVLTTRVAKHAKRPYLYTRREVEDLCYSVEHGRIIANFVLQADPPLLRRVAKLIGYNARTRTVDYHDFRYTIPR